MVSRKIYVGMKMTCGSENIIVIAVVVDISSITKLKKKRKAEISQENIDIKPVSNDGMAVLTEKP